MPKGQVSSGFGKWWSFKPDLSMSCCPVPGSLCSCREREQGAAFERVIKEPGIAVHWCWEEYILCFWKGKKLDVKTLG